MDVGAGKITAHVEGAEEGEYLMLNFVASQGYAVTVNGHSAELIDNDLKFLLVALDKGDNVVEFVYTSPYGNYALIGCLVAVAGLCAVWFIVKRTKFVEWASPVIAWTGIVLAAVVVAFFMLYPTAVWMIKVVKLFV